MENQCRYERVLSAFVDNELSDRQTRKVRQHLETCPECQQKYQEICKINILLGSLPEIELSSEFDRKFWQKIADEEALQEKQHRQPFRFFHFRPVLTAGLAASLSLVLILGIYQYDAHKSISQEEIFMVENIELLRDFELLNHLDLLEYWEVADGIKDNS